MSRFRSIERFAQRFSNFTEETQRERERERVGGDTGGVEFRDRLRKTGRRELDGIDSKNSVVKKKKDVGK